MAVPEHTPLRLSSLNSNSTLRARAGTEGRPKADILKRLRFRWSAQSVPFPARFSSGSAPATNLVPEIAPGSFGPFLACGF